jgi:hypothetical protein
VKVAFQAGALQVLLDEAGLEFDHVDGASGGSFNLAMLCQGMSGREIADNWRRFQPLSIVEPNPKLLLGESIGGLNRLREGGFAAWGLDFDAIRASSLEATFNVYDFTRHELRVVEPRDMDAEMLTACVALPMWFPPIRRAGDVLIDPVYITDANLDEAIRRGADELWVIWTVSRRAHWGRGFVNHYFQVIETAAYGHFKRGLERIEASNRALAEGGHSEYGRHIDVHVLYGEVPLHYLINVRQIRFRRAVEQGVEAARAWCRHEGVPLADAPPAGRPDHVRFTEVMAGGVQFGASDPRTAREETPLRFRITIHVDDLDEFLDDPDREAVATGFVEAAALGGRRTISRGLFNLFTSDDPDPRMKHMRYRLFFRDGEGRPLTLEGAKDIRQDPGHDAWADTTTLYTRILAGHVPEGGDESEVVAAGVLRITPAAFARQLTTFRGSSGSVLRFAEEFAGQLYKTYGRRLLVGG